VLVLDRTAIALAADLGTSVTSQSIVVSSVNGSVDSLAVSKPDCGPNTPWLSATLSASATPATINVAVSPAGLGAGAYSCSLTISSAQKLVDSASQVVKVSLALKAVPRIAVSSDTVKMTLTRTSDGAPVRVSITNAGTGALTGLSLGSITYSTGATNWLTASLDVSSAPATMSLVGSARNLSAGAYSATVPVSSATAGVGNSPTPVTVALNVIPLPSGLVTIPNQVTLTTKQGVLGFWHLTIAVTHSGDVPIGGVGFGPLPPTPNITIMSQLGCIGGVASFTPCTALIDVTAPASLIPGTYPGSVLFMTYPPGQSATFGISVVVTP
jgi:hypothetical protein